VITTPGDLTDKERERLAQRDGNEHVESRVPYDVLMDEAGFIDVELTDVSDQYAKTLTEWKREWEADADAFIELVGEQEFIRRIRNRNLDIANTADGLLQRYQVYGVKP
jgi:cyclopropane fatty-acyl-phospholipid synthase-like methyltransferase